METRPPKVLPNGSPVNIIMIMMVLSKFAAPDDPCRDSRMQMTGLNPEWTR